MSSNLLIQNLSVTFDQKNLILNKVNFQLAKGELASLLGPSGCGKSTLLRTLVGLEKAHEGHIFLNGKDINLEKPHKRKIGLVFQDYALFPHLTAKENILLGLKDKKYDVGLLEHLFSIMKVKELSNRYPHQLSGGQQQRVAIIRTLIRNPEIVLLDEPFSGLDTNLKEEMARELRLLFKDIHCSALLVTHDQKEAFSFSDKIGIMNKGELIQWSTPFDLYHEPHSRFTATFIGETSFIRATKISSGEYQTVLGKFRADNHHGEHSEVDLMVRPDDIHLEAPSHPLAPDEVSCTGIIKDYEFRGPNTMYLIKLQSGEFVKALVPSHQTYQKEQDVVFHVDMDRYIVFP